MQEAACCCYWFQQLAGAVGGRNLATGSTCKQGKVCGGYWKWCIGSVAMWEVNSGSMDWLKCVCGIGSACGGSDFVGDARWSSEARWVGGLGGQRWEQTLGVIEVGPWGCKANGFPCLEANLVVLWSIRVAANSCQ